MSRICAGGEYLKSGVMVCEQLLVWHSTMLPVQILPANLLRVDDSKHFRIRYHKLDTDREFKYFEGEGVGKHDQSNNSKMVSFYRPFRTRKRKPVEAKKKRPHRETRSFPQKDGGMKGEGEDDKLLYRR